MVKNMNELLFIVKSLSYGNFWPLVNFVWDSPRFLALVGFAGFVGVIMLFLRFRNPGDTSHGSAREAARGDVKEFLARNYEDLRDGIVCGRAFGKYVVSKGHVTLIAPTRSGKGTGHIIPTLLEYSGSVLANDMKGELCAVTRSAREQAGQEIFVLNPFRFAEKITGKSNFFNPLYYIDINDPDGITMAEGIVNMICADSESSHGDPFWSNSAKSMICSAILWLCEQRPRKASLPDVRDFLASGTESYISAVTDMREKSKLDAVKRAASDILDTYAGGEGIKTFLGVRSNCAAYLKFLDNTNARAFLSRHDVPLDRLKFEPISIYLVISPAHIEQCSIVARIVYELAYNFTIAPSAKFADTERLPENVLFLLDEFAQLGRMKTFLNGMGIGLGLGATFLLVLQDINQLRGKYRDDALTFISNACSVFIGAKDSETAEMISKMLGTTTVKSFSKSGGSRGGSVSESSHSRPLRTADEILSGGKIPYVFPGFTRGIVAERSDYYNDRRWSKLADPNPYYQK